MQQRFPAQTKVSALGRNYDYGPFEQTQAQGQNNYPSQLEPFLGPATKHIDFVPSQEFPHEAYFLPDAYQGRNDYVRSTLVELVVNYNSFITQKVLPWREQNNPNIAWDSIRFDRTLVDLEPEQGVPRYVTVEREHHTDFMVRRGIALIVNHGFAATPAGREDFAMKLTTIAGATIETCDQAGVMALLRCKNEYKHLIKTKKMQAREPMEAFQHEIWRWGIVQHSERGWYHMDAEAVHCMALENIVPDAWIVPPRMTCYAAMGQLAETDYYRAGERAAGNLSKGEDNFRTFRGKQVYEMRPYTLDVDGRTLDPLRRNKMIGDFFVVPCLGARDSFNTGTPDEHMLMPGEGVTQVYCCETDRFETFEWSHLNKKFFATNHPQDPEPTADEKIAKVPWMQRRMPDTSMIEHGPQTYNSLMRRRQATIAAPGPPAAHDHPQYQHAHYDNTRPNTAHYSGNAADYVDAHQQHPAFENADYADRAVLNAAHEFIRDNFSADANSLSDANVYTSELNPNTHPNLRRCAKIDAMTDAIKEHIQNEMQEHSWDFDQKMQALQAATPNVRDAGLQLYNTYFRNKAAAIQVVNDAAGAVENLDQRLKTDGNLKALKPMPSGSRYGAAAIPIAVPAAGGVPELFALDQFDVLSMVASVVFHTVVLRAYVNNTGETLRELADNAVRAAFGEFNDQAAANAFVDHYKDANHLRSGYDVLKSHTDKKINMALSNERHNFTLMGDPTDTRTQGMQALLHLLSYMGRNSKPVICDKDDGGRGIVHCVPAAQIKSLLMHTNTIQNEPAPAEFNALPATDQHKLIAERIIPQTNPFAALTADDIQNRCLVYALSKTIANIMYTILACTELPKTLEQDSDWQYKFGQNNIQRVPVLMMFNSERKLGLHFMFAQADGPMMLQYNANVQVWAQQCATNRVHIQGDFGLPVTNSAGPADDIVSSSGNKVPMYDFVCFRPFRQYEMGTGMLLKQGSELGNTFRGWADFQMTDNIIAKTHIGHFTFWHASIVTNPKCLFLAEDIFCSNYKSGEGKVVLPMTDNNLSSFRSDAISCMRDNVADIVCYPIPLGSMDPKTNRCILNTPISLTGVPPKDIPNCGEGCMTLGDFSSQHKDMLRRCRQEKQQYDQQVQRAQAAMRYQVPNPWDPFEVSESSESDILSLSAEINNYYAFSEMNTSTEIDMAEKTFDQAGNVVNTVCFHTMQRHRNTKSNCWETSNLNTGHFGEKGIYEGVKKIRCGFLSYYEPPPMQHIGGR